MLARHLNVSSLDGICPLGSARYILKIYAFEPLLLIFFPFITPASRIRNRLSPLMHSNKAKRQEKVVTLPLSFWRSGHLRDDLQMPAVGTWCARARTKLPTEHTLMTLAIDFIHAKTSGQPDPRKRKLSLSPIPRVCQYVFHDLFTLSAHLFLCSRTSDRSRIRSVERMTFFYCPVACSGFDNSAYRRDFLRWRHLNDGEYENN